MNKKIKHVPDLGVAAYLLMHGHQVIGKKGKSIYFACHSPTDVEHFDSLILEYQPPNEFYTFDSCLMFLKKISEVIPEKEHEKNYKCVSDLGVGAYILLHEYRPKSIKAKVAGRKGRQVFFEVQKGNEKLFDDLVFNYLQSPFHSYDSCLMSLKKVGEYITDDM